MTSLISVGPRRHVQILWIRDLAKSGRRGLEVQPDLTSRPDLRPDCMTPSGRQQLPSTKRSEVNVHCGQIQSSKIVAGKKITCQSSVHKKTKDMKKL